MMLRTMKIPSTRIPPTPLFDALEFIDWHIEWSHPVVAFAQQDFIYARNFLHCYKDNLQTFNAYRREIERFLPWCWFISNQSLLSIRRPQMEEYIHFCQSPSLAWIGVKKVPRFILKKGLRLPNPGWRPFVATLSKAAFRQGDVPDKHTYALSQKALQEVFAVLSSFYNYLMQEDIMEVNPIAQIRQKGKFLRKHQTKAKIRRLSERQWQTVIETAESMADENSALHERTLFIMTALFAMYLRISELAASKRWIPKMCDFYRDHDGRWWFKVVGKGNKERDIAVSDTMLTALKHYRKYLGLSVLPSPADQSPLLPKQIGKGPISSTTYIREIVQTCFDEAKIRLEKAGFCEEAEGLLDATVHWLRHTGISEDVKHRPREHVRDDAGHSSSAITDKYIDVELKARHASAKWKKVKSNG